MSDSQGTVNVVLFSGGRGTASITESLLRHSQISLTILVNAYDDGLSTGRLRELIPGMLGPSDVRKSLSRLIGQVDSSDRAMREFLEFRYPDPTSFDEGIADLREFSRMEGKASALTLGQARNIANYCRQIESYILDKDKRGERFDFSDCSLGNLFFAGCYLESGQDFNEAIRRFSRQCRARGRVFNVTQGEGFVLVGLKDDGTILRNEAEIVARQNSHRIDDIFLLDRYLGEREFRELLSLPQDGIASELRRRSRTPQINPEAKAALEAADMIIYGPGTQHSSLFPSYLTEGLAEAIISNLSAEKVFVMNIRKDHEIQSETANSLVEKFMHYMSRKASLPLRWEQVITSFFIHTPQGGAAPSAEYIDFSRDQFRYPLARVTLVDWEAKDGVHRGGRVVDEVISLVNSRLQKKLVPSRSLVSIVIPALNEEKTVRKVLHDLALVDFQRFGLGKEIILVDGGSTDRTLEEARSEPDVRMLRVEANARGRGSAIRLGIEHARGDIIVFFPSDGEYEAKDLIPIVTAVAANDYQVVFGSRLIRCVNLTEQIRKVYRGDWLGYWISKYGGMLISVVSLLLYNRFVSDPFYSDKAFDAKLLRSLALESKGVDLETEIIAKLGALRKFILEVPVEYFPRKKIDGKKTTVLDGVKALLALFKYRITYNAEVIGHHSRVQRREVPA